VDRRPPPIRVASAPRPDPRPRDAGDEDAARRAIAWLWLIGSVVAGATLGRLAPSEIAKSAVSSLSTISEGAPSFVVLVLVVVAAVTSWRAYVAFRAGERAAGIGLGALAGAALLISVEIAI
jgi:hypothetical protein